MLKKQQVAEKKHWKTPEISGPGGRASRLEAEENAKCEWNQCCFLANDHFDDEVNDANHFPEVIECCGHLDGGFKYFCIFISIWGRFPFWSILTNMLQRGWNHQLVFVVVMIFVALFFDSFALQVLLLKDGFFHIFFPPSRQMCILNHFDNPAWLLGWGSHPKAIIFMKFEGTYPPKV